LSKDLIHKKIAEARHNETMSLVVIALGFIVEVIALNMVQPLGYIAIIFVLLGIFLIIGAGIMAFYYSHQRSKLVKQLERIQLASFA